VVVPVLLRHVASEKDRYEQWLRQWEQRYFHGRRIGPVEELVRRTVSTVNAGRFSQQVTTASVIGPTGPTGLHREPAYSPACTGHAF
jgi:hypothetical protein